MKFVLLMSDDPSWDALSSEERAAVADEHAAFEADLRAAGCFLESGRFDSTAARSVERALDGTRSIEPAPPRGGGAIVATT